VQALTGIAIMPNAEMISVGRLRKLKRGMPAKDEKMVLRKKVSVSRQDAAPTQHRQQWEWLPATINEIESIFLR
jgi:hypothetical protein